MYNFWAEEEAASDDVAKPFLRPRHRRIADAARRVAAKLAIDGQEARQTHHPQGDLEAIQLVYVVRSSNQILSSLDRIPCARMFIPFISDPSTERRLAKRRGGGGGGGEAE